MLGCSEQRGPSAQAANRGVLDAASHSRGKTGKTAETPETFVIPEDASDASFRGAKGDNPARRLTTPENAANGEREAPVGVEPTMVDLQSTALATWRRRRTQGEAEDKGNWLSGSRGLDRQGNQVPMYFTQLGYFVSAG